MPQPYATLPQKLAIDSKLKLSDGNEIPIFGLGTYCHIDTLTFLRQKCAMVSEFENLFHKNGAGTLRSRLDESYVKKLLNYFKSRG